MHILGIETSCDETSVAIIEGHEDNVVLKANIVASSLAIHAQTGGVIPENAAREQIKFILPVLQEALHTAFPRDTRGTRGTRDTFKNIDAIALTYGPGLIGSLLVGVETAKTIAYVLNKPIVPVNHMVGHIYANWLLGDGTWQLEKEKPTANRQPLTAPTFPAIALVISGGHTDLLLMKNHGELTLLGGTRDDAAGEAFDKIGRLLGLPYPAGPVIEQLAKKGDPKRFRFPRPLIGSPDFDFSFSGLKTAVLNEVKKLEKPLPTSPSQGRGTSHVPPDKGADEGARLLDKGGKSRGGLLDEQTIADISRGTLDAIIDVVTRKTLKAAQQHNAKSILISGGVAANQTLIDEFKLRANCQLPTAKIFAPQKSLSTDNAAMVAAAAYFNYNPVDWKDITANPELYF